MLSINTNTSSLIAQNSMKSSTDKLNQAIERMTTGAKINHAKDNAANYSIATNMTTKINAYQVAEDNCAMGLDLISTASSSLEQMSDLTSRLRSLATQAQNGTYGNQSLDALNTEAQAIVQELSRIKNTTTYNGIELLNGSVNTAESGHFIDEVTKRDTSAMTTLASVDENTALTSGTYSISTAEELAKLATMTNNGKIGRNTEFVLANDIDLSAYSTGEGWTPIGSASSFVATFDGNGYVVSNLYINRPDEDYQGLFGRVWGVIKNIGLENVNVTGGNQTGGLVGEHSDISAPTISNCYVIGNITGETNVGGLYGYAGDMGWGPTFEYCYTAGSVTGVSQVGGLVGFCDGAISGSYSVSSVIGNDIVGGLVGKLWVYGTIRNSYTTGDISGGTNCGSIYGAAETPHITDNVYATGTLNTFGSYMSIAELDELIEQGILPDYIKETKSTNFNLQVGINSSDSSQIGLKIAQIDISVLDGLDMSATNALSTIDEILKTISEQQTSLGAVQNRLESALDEISTQYDNLVSSRSTIQDADIAEVSSEYIKMQILQQASATLMATANQSPAIALQLL